MDDKTKKTALMVTTIVTASCLVLALGLGVLSRFMSVSVVFYYIIAYIALFSMLTDNCIRKKGIVRFIMVLIYSVCIAAITLLIFFKG